MKRHIPLVLASCLFAQSSFAGGLSDPIVPAPIPPAPVSVPLDFYVGLQFGIGSGDATPEVPDTAFPETAIEGPFYGIHAGVRRSFGSFTAGVEVDYNTAPEDLEDSGTVTVVEMETLAHLKLQLGRNIGQTFIYGTTGMAYASGRVEPIGLPFDFSDNALFYGLGADLMVTESISVGGEFLVHSFEDVGDSDLDLDFNTAMLRVSYHF